MTDNEARTRHDGLRREWKDFLAAAGSIATLGSALIYGLVALGYSEFYRELGIAPRDVGVEVGKTLGDAVGLAILLTVVSSLLALLLDAAWVVCGQSGRVKRVVEKHRWSRWLVAQGGLRRFTTLFIAAAVLSFLGAAVAIRVLANTRADQVKEGRPVEPLRIGPGWFDFLPLEVLDVHADPVVAIAPLRATDRVPDALDNAHTSGRLFYLGRASGSVVLYEAKTQHSFVAPETSFVFELSNCETIHNLDKACIAPKLKRKRRNG
jgi:hypothetical protein